MPAPHPSPRRAPSPPWLLAAGLAFAGTAFAGTQFEGLIQSAQAEAEAPGARLHSLVKNVNNVRREQLELRTRFEQDRAREAATLARLEQELRALKSSPGTSTASQPESGAAVQAPLPSAWLDFEALRAGALTVLQTARTRVEQGIEVDTQARLAELSRIEQQLLRKAAPKQSASDSAASNPEAGNTKGNAPRPIKTADALPEAEQQRIEDQIRAIASLFDWLARELHLGGSVEVTDSPVELDQGSRRVHAHILRLGLLTEAFVSEDDRDVGLRTSRSQEYRTDLDEGTRSALTTAVRVLRRETEPELVALPMGSLAARPASSHQEPTK